MPRCDVMRECNLPAGDVEFCCQGHELNFGEVEVASPDRVVPAMLVKLLHNQAFVVELSGRFFDDGLWQSKTGIVSGDIGGRPMIFWKPRYGCTVTNFANVLWLYHHKLLVANGSRIMRLTLHSYLCEFHVSRLCRFAKPA